MQITKFSALKSAALRRATSAMFCTNHKPLLVILGATGAGKSKLALDIAAKVGGEIISADAMQVYKGLDIVTNKVTKEEQDVCPHHMIGFLSPKEEFTIVDFQKNTMKIIDEIHKRNRLPILVGGTNYYVESILFDFLLKTKGQDSDLTKSNIEHRMALNDLSYIDAHKQLVEVDPDYAAFLHPRDKRKVIRALEVFYETGKRMSEHIAQQRTQSGGSYIGGPVRFPDSCVMWVQCEPEVLKDRIYRRVDKMISRGLLKELSEFHEEYNKERLREGLEPNYEHGIFQSIGFKEFHSYLVATSSNAHENPQILAEATERMKLSTWQYAKYQKKWINKRIVNRPISVDVYGLDATDPEMWDEKVFTPAMKILKSHFKSNSGLSIVLNDIPDEDYHLQPLEKQTAADCKKSNRFKACIVCDGKLIIESDWEGHIKSKKHKHFYRKMQKKLELTSEILEARQNHLSQRNHNNEVSIERIKSAEENKLIMRKQALETGPISTETTDSI
ncbi:unnamed protein product [Clavelina lepadiformis]|uniref:tRNA dimethylallyltransferase n=1 Tax=Clavelina lepadiformis TaxID=159417 RepID=A0ABP0H2I5_CLALP